MSSILKALKKLEAEKTPHEEAAGINVSREILGKQPTGRNTTRILWIVVLVALGVIATLTALLLKRPSHQAASTAAPPAPVSAPTTVTPPAAGSVTPSARPEPSGRIDTAPPQTNTETRPQPATPLRSAPAPAASLLPSTTGSGKPVPVEKSPPTPLPTQTETGRNTPSRQTDHAAPTLTLSGIAWNKDSADRLAIINGQPTATGATVGGVVVEEILPDRVKVNSAGRSFEIFLGSPAKTN